jgi:hypothetical protein
MWTSIATSVRSCRFYRTLVQLCHQFEMSFQVKPIHRLFCLIFILIQVSLVDEFSLKVNPPFNSPFSTRGRPDYDEKTRPLPSQYPGVHSIYGVSTFSYACLSISAYFTTSHHSDIQIRNFAIVLCFITID